MPEGAIVERFEAIEGGAPDALPVRAWSKTRVGSSMVFLSVIIKDFL